MKNMVWLLLLILVACEADPETAARNMEKGNTFLEKGEYDVAQYYYEKIPESSPLYQQAQEKLKEIEKAREINIATGGTNIEIGKIVILEHTYAVDNTGRIPNHRLSLRNDGKKRIEAISLEFTYVNQDEKEVGKLTTDLTIALYPGSQDVYKNIKPGVLLDEFARSIVKITAATEED